MQLMNPLEMMLESEEARRYISRDQKRTDNRGQYSYVYYFSKAFFPTGNCAV